MTIELDLTEQELKDSFLAVEDGTITGEEAFENTLIWQKKNRETYKKLKVVPKNANE